MPVYNSEHSLRLALESILEQTFKAWKLIVVDDGSTDETASILDTFRRKDQRIQVVRTKHQGIACALNEGLTHCRAPFVARMDADDWAYPERLEKQIAYLAEHYEVSVLGTQVEYGGDRETQAGYARYIDWMNTIVTAKEFVLNAFIESPLAHPSVMLRRSVFEQHGGYTEKAWPEDYELWLRLLAAKVEFAKVSEVLLKWNDPPARLSRNHTHYSADAFYACKAYYLAKWLRERNLEQRTICIWGAGRVTRKRVGLLVAEGISVSFYVDVDSKKVRREIDGIPVMDYEKLYKDERYYILSYVSAHGAREEIQSFLEERGFQVELDYMLIS